MSSLQQLEPSQIDLCFSFLRLPDLRAQRRLRVSVESEGGIREPLLVSSAVEGHPRALVDGFKRLDIAKELQLSHVLVRVEQLPATQAKVRMLKCNQARPGPNGLAEAWIVRSLCRDERLTQQQVAKLLRKTQSWVSHRVALAENLDERLRKDVQLGLLSVSAAQELAKIMPRRIQAQAGDAVAKHKLTRRQTAWLVQELKRVDDPQTVSAILDDPLRHFASANGLRHYQWRSDPPLTDGAIRLWQLLRSWERAGDRLTRQLPEIQASHDLSPVLHTLHNTLQSGKQVLRQLEALCAACNAQSPQEHLKSTITPESSDA